MAAPDDNNRLDELEHKIDTARKQVEDSGILTDTQPDKVEYEPGDPVGVPDPQPAA
jgi:hypothetical protein